MKKNDKSIERILNIFENKSDGDYLSLYFHIPFCKQRCFYCNYISSTDKQNYIHPYFNSLIKEIARYKNILKSKKIRSIYFGGGTPSLVNSKFISLILDKIREYNNFDKSIEVTLELNPESVTFEKLEHYKKIGVNRLSIGLQVYNNKLLKTVNRITTTSMFETTMQLIKKVGFDNYSVDIMIGFPFQTFKDVKLSLKKALSYNPTHISIYSLILEPGTKLDKLINEGKMKLPTENMVIKSYIYCLRTLNKHGLYFYEIGNFSKPGYESIHNINYWFHKNFLGFGVGAYGMIDSYDYFTENNLCAFCDGKIKSEKFLKSVDEITTEKIMLGLRTIYGIPLSLIKPDKLTILKNFIDAGFLKVNNARIVATQKGFFVLDQLIIALV